MNNNDDKKFGDFVKYFLQNYNENCFIFESFYEELFNYIGYNDFYSVSFEMIL
jgi:hypothetical protein